MSTRTLGWVMGLGLAAIGGAAGCAADDGAAGQGDEANLTESADGVFTSTDDLVFSLDAPWARLIRRMHNEKADPLKEGEEADPSSPDISEPGTLKIGERSFDVTVQIRGNTSRRDCAFPKYKIEFANKEQIAGTPFQDNKKIRVNSHCGDGGPDDHDGDLKRVQNQISPIREEFAYRMVRAAGIPTYRTRLAKISYTDRSPSAPLPAMERYGLVLESDDVAAERFAAEGLIPKDGKALSDAPPDGTSKLDKKAIAKTVLTQVLLGNFDWSLGDLGSGGMWNVDVFGVAGTAGQLGIPQDFDLSNVVQALDTNEERFDLMVPRYRNAFVFAPKGPAGTSAVAHFKKQKQAILDALVEVEKADIAKKIIPSTDGEHSTDKGFVNAHRLFDMFYALDELK